MKTLTLMRGKSRSAGNEARPLAPVLLHDPIRALFFRGSLPGAFVYDQAAYTLRMQVEAGAHPLDLLPLAFPASWLVNAKAVSTVFQRLVYPDALGHWESIASLFHDRQQPWATATPDEKRGVAYAIAQLATIPGSSLSSVTKILALLLPAQIPIMADSEAWFTTDLIVTPTAADGELGGAELFAPMMDWYDAEQTALGTHLNELAATHQLVPLLPRQVLDRLVWYASWGVRMDPQRVGPLSNSLSD